MGVKGFASTKSYLRLRMVGIKVEFRLPNRRLLLKTNDVDYFYWNYQFPIKYIIRYRYKLILELMNDENYNKLLEFGIGSGIFLPELSTHCSQLYAIDIHDRIESVQQFCKHQKINANISKCSIERTNFPDNYLDAIIGVSVLEFIDDLKSALNEIKRILKPNGIFFTICPQRNFLLDFIISFFSDKLPNEEFLNSRDEISPMLEQSFKVIEKRIFPPVFGKLLPLYNAYKLRR